MPYLTADDGVLIYYAEEGQGEPILLIHGWTFNHKLFERNVAEMARTHRVIAADIRGHGHSGKQESNWTLKQAARDVRTLVDSLDLGDVTVVGWSMGALVVLDYLDQFGDGKVKGVVLVDAGPYLLNDGGWEHGAFGNLDAKGALGVEKHVLEDRMDFQEGFVAACFAGGQAPEKAAAESWLREGMLTPDGAVVAYAVAMVADDWREHLPRVGVPVLLCYGARSAVYPTKVRDYVREQIPNSELVVFEDSGHSPFWEEPEKFNAEIVRFAG